jgi:hypothetical protein
MKNEWVQAKASLPVNRWEKRQQGHGTKDR